MEDHLALSLRGPASSHRRTCVSQYRAADSVRKFIIRYLTYSKTCNQVGTTNSTAPRKHTEDTLNNTERRGLQKAWCGWCDKVIQYQLLVRFESCTYVEMPRTRND